MPLKEDSSLKAAADINFIKKWGNRRVKCQTNERTSTSSLNVIWQKMKMHSVRRTVTAMCFGCTCQYSWRRQYLSCKVMAHYSEHSSSSSTMKICNTWCELTCDWVSNTGPISQYQYFLYETSYLWIILTYITASYHILLIKLSLLRRSDSI